MKDANHVRPWVEKLWFNLQLENSDGVAEDTVNKM